MNSKNFAACCVKRQSQTIFYSLVFEASERQSSWKRSNR